MSGISPSTTAAKPDVKKRQRRTGVSLAFLKTSSDFEPFKLNSSATTGMSELK